MATENQHEAWLLLRPLRFDRARGRDAPRPGWGWCPLYDDEVSALAAADGDLTMILRLVLIEGSYTPAKWIRG